MTIPTLENHALASSVRTRKRRVAIRIALALLVAFCLWFALNAGKMLVVDSPQPSDLIVVLAGETDLRPAYGVKLLGGGYARRMLINVPANAKVYGFTEPELAKQYIQKFPQSASISVCPIHGLSTRDESHDVAECLAHENAARILIVTSDYHTRRSLSIFRHEIPGKNIFDCCRSRRHSVWRLVVEAPSMVKDLLGRVVAAALVDFSGTVALSKTFVPRGKCANCNDKFSTEKRLSGHIRH